MRIKTRLQYIASKLHYDSFPQRVLDLMKVFRIGIYPFYILREGLSPAAADVLNNAPDGFEIRVATPGDMPQLLGFPDRNESLEKLQERLARGDLCLVAWSNGKVVGFTWACTDRFLNQLYRFEFREDEAYLYDAYTSTECRGRGLAGYLRCRMYEVLAEKGRRNLFSISDRFNKPALRFKLKLGAQIVDSCFAVNFFRRWRIGTAARPEKLRRQNKK